MFAAYVSITILASVFAAIASVTYLVGHAYPKAQLEMKRLPQSWMPMLGTILAAGSLGLLAGFAIPLLGELAAGGLLLYLVRALPAQLPVCSRNPGPSAVFFVT